MQAVGTWKGGYETLLEDDHAHSVVVDLPIDEGGRSSGPSALDLALLSLAGCVSTIFTLVAHKRRLEFQGLSVALEGERPDGAATITRVHGTLRIRTRASLAEVETALRLTIRTCPVGVLFERAGVPVEIRPIVAPPTPAAVAAAMPR
jgi:putative redox protein